MQIGSQRRRRSSAPASTSFVTKYLVAVSNDGTHYGPPRPVYVYDSSCQNYVVLGNGDLLFSLKVCIYHSTIYMIVHTYAMTSIV